MVHTQHILITLYTGRLKPWQRRQDQSSVFSVDTAMNTCAKQYSLNTSVFTITSEQTSGYHHHESLTRIVIQVSSLQVEPFDNNPSDTS